MSTLPPPVRVLQAAELQQVLNTNPADCVLLQITSAELFDQVRLPGAQLVTPAELVDGTPPATGKLPSLARLQALFGRLGVDPATASDKTIVVFDDEGGGWAGRMGWTLDVVGITQWVYLDGGMHGWQAAGLGFESGAPASRDPSAVSLTLDTSPIAEMADVMASLDDPQQVVWDVRSHEEYIGTRQAAQRVGHIPGAVNLDWLHLKDPQTQMLPDDLQALLTHLGIADKRIITHCQTHHRSGLSYMVGRILGLDIRAYHGSWSEWGNHPETPIELPQGDA